MGTVLGKKQISNGCCAQGLHPRLQAASAFRVRGTYYLSCPFEDAIRRIEVLGLPRLAQHCGWGQDLGLWAGVRGPFLEPRALEPQTGKHNSFPEQANVTSTPP